ncbi:50S ribosomal protein L6 [candidate division WWE3 bacterium RIFCSPHIGHO2_01_FULL_42_13]|uniref:Large ribosomal subunit protein uL6 n=1 Tax=candidate division WWE3 bacterium RIFCSPHIGHO2_01_FULL_42_13 TaxID=1802617 RepID=A0A1F4UQM7_UNCKA|nr:MAG: 50S ribosomal protein L6 [candidate division WWE3 bacterium RIFCSPHIGHO2_01_FULL_42_13]
MSRIGSQIIEIPAGVTVTVSGGRVVVKGPNGELTQEIRPEIDVKVEDSKVVTSVKIQTNDSPALWGLTRALINNMVKGVTQDYQKKLQMLGVGYRAKKVSDSKISLTVGFSHPVDFEAPQGINLDVEENNVIVIKGANKQLVGLTAAKIRRIREPEPYKGKGIRYEDEYVKRKPGKAGKVL